MDIPNNNNAVATILAFLESAPSLHSPPTPSVSPVSPDKSSINNKDVSTRSNIGKIVPSVKETNQPPLPPKWDSIVQEDLVHDQDHDYDQQKQKPQQAHPHPHPHPQQTTSQSKLLLLEEWKPSTSFLLLHQPQPPQQQSRKNSSNSIACDILDHAFGLPFLRRLQHEIIQTNISQKLQPAKTKMDVTLQQQLSTSTSTTTTTTPNNSNTTTTSSLRHLGGGVRGDSSTFVPRTVRSSPNFGISHPMLERLVLSVEATVVTKLSSNNDGRRRSRTRMEFDVSLTSVQIASYPGDGESGYVRHCDRGKFCRMEGGEDSTATADTTRSSQQQQQQQQKPERLVTAVYYITDEDWNREEDGGFLRIYEYCSSSLPPRDDGDGGGGGRSNTSSTNTNDTVPPPPTSSQQQQHPDEEQDGPTKETFHDIVPYADRLVLFRSDLVEHRVFPSKRRNRMAITIWLYGVVVLPNNGDEDGSRHAAAVTDTDDVTTVVEQQQQLDGKKNTKAIRIPSLPKPQYPSESFTTKNTDPVNDYTHTKHTIIAKKNKPPPLTIHDDGVANDSFDLNDDNDVDHGINLNDIDDDDDDDDYGIDLNDIDDDVDDDDGIDLNDIDDDDDINLNDIDDDDEHDDNNNANTRIAINQQQQQQQQLNMQARIFVSIPSYRDTETYPTIQSLLQNATYPNRIHIGVVLQYDTTSEEEGRLFAPPPPSSPSQFTSNNNNSTSTSTVTTTTTTNYPYSTNLRTLTLDYRHATGPCYARHLAQSLYRGEEYVLQIDSHMRFRENWDRYLIQQISLCPTPERAVLTCYPPGYKLPDNYPGGVGGCGETRGTMLVPWKFDGDGMLRQKGRLLQPMIPIINSFDDDDDDEPSFSSNNNDNAKNDNVPCLLYAAGFNFSHSSTIFDCPYDAHLPHLFFGEEPSMAVRLFTNGYDLFAPPETVCYHLWERDYRKTFQNDTNAHVDVRRKKEEDRQRSLETVRRQLRGDGRGLGTVRTVGEFERRLGVTFSNSDTNDNDDSSCGVIERGAEDGGLNPCAFVGITSVGCCKDGGGASGVVKDEDGGGGQLTRQLFSAMFSNNRPHAI